TRKISYITEVTGMEGEVIALQDIFQFQQQGFGADGKVQGRFVATGFVPKFYDELRRRGIPVDLQLFGEPAAAWTRTRRGPRARASGCGACGVRSAAGSSGFETGC